MFVLLNLSGVSWAVSMEPQSASFEFKNTSVSGALQKISRDTGISIYAPFDQLNGKVTKSYTAANIEKIIKDMMRNQDHAIVWQYQNQKIVSIDIQLAPGKGSQHMSGGKGLNSADSRKNEQNVSRNTQKNKGLTYTGSSAGKRKNYAMGDSVPNPKESNIEQPENNRSGQSGAIENNQTHGNNGNSANSSDSESQLTQGNNQKGTGAAPPSAPSAKELPPGLEAPPAPPGM